jgi:hypothetical protein
MFDPLLKLCLIIALFWLWLNHRFASDLCADGLEGPLPFMKWQSSQ